MEAECPPVLNPCAMGVYRPQRWARRLSDEKTTQPTFPQQIVKKLHDADVMLISGKSLTELLRLLRRAGVLGWPRLFRMVHY